MLRTTVLRSLALGRLFIGVGVVYVIVLAVALSYSSPASFSSAYPIFLPIFAVLGSMGGLMVFTNDRTKGVLEYLIAYGLTPRRQFVNGLIVALLLETGVLVLVLGLGLGIFVFSGHRVSLELVKSLGLYSVPMSYASAAFATTVGMLWTSLSSPRSGMNSPIGLIPFIGIAPSLLTLGLVAFLGVQGDTDTLVVTGSAVVAVVVLVLVLVGFLDRLMARERLLAPV